MPELRELLLYLPLLIISFTVHEFGHAWVALKQGDDTAYMQGRVTLNPAAHIDPLGSLLLPTVGILTGGMALGWARPVPVTTRKFRNYRRGDLLTSAAGIAGNLLLVFVFAIIGEAVALVRSHGVAAQAMASLQQMCWMGGVLNVALIVFNLLPVPPLDGSRLIVHFLSPRGVQAYREFERYGFAALWVLLFLGAFGFIGPLAAGANALVVTLVDLPFGLFG